MKKVREPDKKPEPTEEKFQQESQTSKDEPEAKTSKPEEEGEIEDGEETAATNKSTDLELKELRENLKWVVFVCVGCRGLLMFLCTKDGAEVHGSSSAWIM